MTNKLLIAVLATSLTCNVFLGMFAKYVFDGKFQLICSDTVN